MSLHMAGAVSAARITSSVVTLCKEDLPEARPGAAMGTVAGESAAGQGIGWVTARESTPSWRPATTSRITSLPDSREEDSGAGGAERVCGPVLPGSIM